MPARSQHDLIVIAGAGPQGLAAAAHLCDADPNIRDRLIIVDPAGCWLDTWHRQFRALEITQLRSPVVHHCGVEPMALANFARREGRADELLPPYGAPTTSLFAAFTRHLAARLELDQVVRPTELCQVSIAPRELTARLGDGSEIAARAVIVATNPHRVLRPDWAPRHPAVRHTTELSHLDARPGQRWAVIGAGLSAAHVAVTAVDQGASVVMIARRVLRTSEFDTDPGWLGPKFLDGFEAEPDPIRRYQLVLAARDGGSVPSWMLTELRRRQRDGALVIHEERRVLSCATGRTSSIRLVLDNGEHVEVDQVVLATGTAPDVRAEPALTNLVNEDNTLPEGVPKLERDLSWAHPRLFVVGRLAMLQLGPTAGNLSGARFGAVRITRALLGEDPCQVSVDAPTVQRRCNRESDSWAPAGSRSSTPIC